jgi:hypothetical protein
MLSFDCTLSSQAGAGRPPTPRPSLLAIAAHRDATRRNKT